MKPEKYVLSLSGGKDSTAMLLRLLEEKRPVDLILFCDTGLEFPQMYEHLDRLEVLVVKGDNLYLIKNFNRLGFLHVNNLTYKTSQRYIFNTFATIFIL